MLAPMAEPLVPPPSARSLRSDAARNQERILDAARAAIDLDGAGVHLEDVARRAGVSLATLYRRFDGRAAVIRAVFERFLAVEVDPILAAVAGNVDAARGLAVGLEGIAEVLVEHVELLRAAQESGVLDAGIAARFLDPLGGALRQAQAAGRVRPDVRPEDLAVVVAMIVATVGWPSGPSRSTTESAREIDWRRYLGLLLDGLRSSSRHTPLDDHEVVL